MESNTQPPEDAAEIIEASRLAASNPPLQRVMDDMQAQLNQKLHERSPGRAIDDPAEPLTSFRVSDDRN